MVAAVARTVTQEHVDPSEKPAGLPECGEAKACDRANCPDTFEIGFGLAGGGYGVYEYCKVCGLILSKTQVHD